MLKMGDLSHVLTKLHRKRVLSPNLGRASFYTRKTEFSCFIAQGTLKKKKAFTLGAKKVVKKIIFMVDS